MPGIVSGRQWEGGPSVLWLGFLPLPNTHTTHIPPILLPFPNTHTHTPQYSSPFSTHTHTHTPNTNLALALLDKECIGQ